MNFASQVKSQFLLIYLKIDEQSELTIHYSVSISYN